MIRNLVGLLSLLLFNALHAQMRHVPGDLLVMLDKGTQANTVAADLTRIGELYTGLKAAEEVSAPMRIWRFQFDHQAVPQEAMLRYVKRHPGVRMAQNNHYVESRNTPNDPGFGQQWHHEKIQSEDAWDITTGGLTATGDTIVVCIIEGASLPHPDLIDNAWFNHAEIPNNGIDDDGNGYVDDHRGWNPATNNDNVYNGAHGTQVAGMIGAKGNNGQQVAGINWDVKMMVVNYQSTQEAHVLAAYTYPMVMRRLYNNTNGQEGAFVVATNASWGINYGNPANAPLWCAMYDTLGAEGVLNCGATANLGINVDVQGDLPTACGSDFMVSVTNTTSADLRNNGAAYGATTIDLGAPGTQVVTTTINGGTGATSGTSFSSPLTAGLIGLLYSVPCPSLMSLVHADPYNGALHVRQALFDGVDLIPALEGITVTGGRINAYNSVMRLLEQCGSCPVPSGPAVHDQTIGTADITWSMFGDALFDLRYRPVGSNVWTLVEGLDTTHAALAGLDACQPYEYQIRALCGSDSSDFGNTFTFLSEGCCTHPDPALLERDSSTATLQLTGVLAAAEYEVRYRPLAGGNWTVEVTTGTLTHTLDELEACSYYEVQARSLCSGNDSPWSESIEFKTTGCDDCSEMAICAIEGMTEDEWIQRFQLGNIDNTSGDNNGYADFTEHHSTALTSGASHTFTATPGYSGMNYSERFSLFIDLDQDGVFTMAERVYTSPSTVTAAHTATFTCPTVTSTLQTRLRVVMRYQNPGEPCGELDYGEAEDYCVSIEPGMSISDVNRNALGAYPVPADTHLNLLVPTGTPAGAVLEFLDEAGRTVHRTRAVPGLNTIDTGNWARGGYLYRLLSPTQAPVHGRIVVSH